MKDQRLYARFTLDFPDSRKILPLSDAAFRCYVEAVLWSRKEESDGFLARRLALAKWSLDTLVELCHNDAENPSLIEHEEGWYIHDYASQQDTKAEIDARRDRAKVAGQKGGLAKAKRTAKRVAKQTVSEVLSENVAKTETETYTDKEQEPPYPPRREPEPDRLPSRQTGSEIARTKFSAIQSAASVNAREIAHAYSRSLPVPIPAKVLGEVGKEIDGCLRDAISPGAIAAGLKAWTASDSWSPTQIPNFVHKANNRAHSAANGVGKATAKALGYDDALNELLREVTTL